MRSSEPIPTIDLEPFRCDRRSTAAHEVVSEVRAACESVGFLVVAGHGVSEALIARMSEVTRSFFELPVEEKLRVDFPEIGYRASESGSLAKTKGRESPGDLCETFRYSPSASVSGSTAASAFPPTPREMRTTWIEYFERLCAFAGDIMVILARALHLDDDWFAPYFEHHSSALIANFYATPSTPPRPGQWRRGAHTDFGAVTVLHQSSDHGGLEVRHPSTKTWIPVPYLEGTFVVNIGDLMERWTNGRWVSTLHRVANLSTNRVASPEARLSLPFFHRPNPAATISVIESCIDPLSPPRFSPVNAGRWMANKQRLIYRGPNDNGDSVSFDETASRTTG